MTSKGHGPFGTISNNTVLTVTREDKSGAMVQKKATTALVVPPETFSRETTVGNQTFPEVLPSDFTTLTTTSVNFLYFPSL